MERAAWARSVIAVVRILLLSFVVVVGACAVGESPEVPVGADGVADPVLVRGREIYSSRCASCHGADGSGGRGPNITGSRVIDRYPDIADQIDLVVNGRGGMPAFGRTFDVDELDAVVRYTREVL